ncbi:PolC-type DNA polymerase III [Mycoplasmatota bacterium WC44]
MELHELIEMLNIKDSNYFENGSFSVTVDVTRDTWIFNFELKEILPISIYSELIKKLIERFSSENKVSFEFNYNNDLVPKNLVKDYFNYAYNETVNLFPRVVILENFEKKFDDKIVIEVSCPNDEEIVLDKLDYVNTRLSEYGVRINFEIEYNEEASNTEEIINNKHEKLTDKLTIGLESVDKNKRISTGAIKGKTINIKDLPISKEELDEYANDKVVIEGYVFSSNMRKFQRGSTLVEALVTNFKDSIKIKKIIRERDDKLVQTHIDILTEGNWIKCSGHFNFDKYANDVVIDIENISTMDLDSNEELDTEPEKRVELHTHTKMSSMDGITSVKEYVKKAVKWGHNAIAVTDHNTVQAFPEFNYATKGEDIKPIYGVELSYIDDTNMKITTNEQELNLLESTFVVFDIETTGFSVNHDEIIEIAAVKIENGNFTEFSSFVKANRKLSEKTTQITSIKDEDLIGAPSIDEVMKEFKNFARGSILVAHNADFDLGHIYENYKKLGIYQGEYSSIDTLQLARVLYIDELKYFNLKSVSKFLKVNLTQHHRAIYDTRATADILVKMLTETYNRGIKFHHQLNNLITDDIIHKLSFPKHITVLAKNRIGLKNMYKILSDASTTRFFKEPRSLKSVIEKHRDGILIGSSCVNGEIFETALNKDYSELKSKAGFYDYLEIQPPQVYSHLAEGNGDRFSSYILDAIKRIVQVGDELTIPVVATGDAHHLYKDQVDYRKIYLGTPQVGGGLHPLKRVKRVPSMYFRTTNQMLEDFDFLKEKAKEVVIDNTNMIADEIEEFDLFPKELFTPKDDFFADRGIPSIKEEVENMVWTNTKNKYGKQLPDLVKNRVEHELNTIINRGFGNVYYISHLLVKKSLENKYLVGSRGSVGSSFVATMMDITEVNPLPPHYVCPHCQFSVFKTVDGESDARTAMYQEELQKVESGYDLQVSNCPICGEKMDGDGQDIPFATFLGFKGDKVPDIDLNFSGEYQGRAHEDIRKMFGTDYAFRAGTISTIQDRTAYGYVKGYSKDNNIFMRDAEVQRQVKEITGVRRSTGQHPGGIVVVPHEVEIYDVTPIQYPADDTTSTWRTTHFDYHSFESNLFKLDVLGHDDPSVIRYLMDFVEKYPNEFPFSSVYDIPMVDKKVLSLFSSTDALRTNKSIMSSVGTYGLPELGTNFVRQMLEDTKPKTFAELLKISGLSHGTDVWLNNAKDLIQGKTEFGTIDFTKIIGCRDDIMIYLMYQGLDPADAYDITETARRTGRFLNDKQKSLMKEKGVPEWYIWSCDQIKYMFPKAHAAAYIMMALRIGWFKLHRPIYFYATYLSKRADYFDVEAFVGGYDAIKDRIDGIREEKQPSNRDINLITVLEIALEMTARGYSFKNIDINCSEATEFKITEDKRSLILPFVTVDGLGKNVADSIVSARKEQEFTSIEDLNKRTRLSKTLIKKLTDLDVLIDLDEKEEGNQMSLF